jgi:hypothetical protein
MKFSAAALILAALVAAVAANPLEENKRAPCLPIPCPCTGYAGCCCPKD